MTKEKLADKFCIYVSNTAEYNQIREIFKVLYPEVYEHYKNMNGLCSTSKYIRIDNIDKNDITGHSYSSYIDDPILSIHGIDTVYTAQEFIDLSNIDKYTVVGYISPIDLFGGTVPKGTLWSKKEPNYEFYNINNSNSGQMVPKEIVETWEPKYEVIYKEYTLPNGKVIKYDPLTKYFSGTYPGGSEYASFGLLEKLKLMEDNDFIGITLWNIDISFEIFKEMLDIIDN